MKRALFGISQIRESDYNRRIVPEDRNQSWYRFLAQSAEDVRALHQMCREGRLYDVEDWIAEGRSLQLAPEAVRRGARPSTALEIALGRGQHSLALLLLRSGYQLEL